MTDLMKDLMKMAEAANPGVKYCPNCNARMRPTSGTGDYSYSCACGTSYFGRGPVSGLLDRGVAVESCGGIPGRLYTHEPREAVREIDPSGPTKACGVCDKNMIKVNNGHVCGCGQFSPDGSNAMYEIEVLTACDLIHEADDDE